MSVEAELVTTNLGSLPPMHEALLADGWVAHRELPGIIYTRPGSRFRVTYGGGTGRIRLDQQVTGMWSTVAWFVNCPEPAVVAAVAVIAEMMNKELHD